jgi:hypothetical protein
MTKRFLLGFAALIALLGVGCTSSPTTGGDPAAFKQNCPESEYLTGPQFPTCNNF